MKTTNGLPPAASPDHLSDVLRRAGVLGDGRAADVAVESARNMLISRILRLRVTYD